MHTKNKEQNAVLFQIRLNALVEDAHAAGLQVEIHRVNKFDRTEMVIEPTVPKNIQDAKGEGVYLLATPDGDRDVVTPLFQLENAVTGVVIVDAVEGSDVRLSPFTPIGGNPHIEELSIGYATEVRAEIMKPDSPERYFIRRIQ